MELLSATLSSPCGGLAAQTREPSGGSRRLRWPTHSLLPWLPKSHLCLRDVQTGAGPEREGEIGKPALFR